MQRDKRLSQVGRNSAGDRVYSRTASGGGSSLDWDSLTVADLKGLLKHMGLPTSGSKAELQERLRDSQ